MDEKATILVVDDSVENIDLLSQILKQEYKVKAATNGKQALKLSTASPPPSLIILDIMMPEMDGYEVCTQLQSNPQTSHIPVIFVSAKNHADDERKGFDCGAVDFITKPISPSVVEARVATHLAVANQQRHLESLVKERTAELEQTRLDIIRKLGRAAEYKDNETGMHVIRMSWYSKFIAEKISDNQDWIDLVFKASPMHDIGKIGIPDNILLKPGKLDADEWNKMKQHTQYGAKILGNSEHPLLKMATEIALYHHEKWDGSGYPKGIKGENIPLSARVVAIADVYDALTSERPYKKAWPMQKAIDLVKAESGKHFDPILVDVFLTCLPQIQDIQNKYMDTFGEDDDTINTLASTR